jgi:hypothetical protein
VSSQPSWPPYEKCPHADRTADRDITLNDAIDQFLTQHLLGEKGRDAGTVDDYRRLHNRWFATEIGNQRMRDIDEATIDRPLLVPALGCTVTAQWPAAGPPRTRRGRR